MSEPYDLHKAVCSGESDFREKVAGLIHEEQSNGADGDSIARELLGLIRDETDGDYSDQFRRRSDE